MKFLTAALSLLLTAAMIETTIAEVCTSEIDVCVAIDNSGSVCTEGNKQKLCNYCDKSQSCKADGEPELGNEALCCKNYETLTGFASTYIQQLESDQTTVHVVKYATDAVSIRYVPKSHGGDGFIVLAVRFLTRFQLQQQRNGDRIIDIHGWMDEYGECTRYMQR